MSAPLTPGPRTYWFDLVLADVDQMTEDAANALFEAGCDDGSPGSSCGVATVMFARQAASLELAVATAVRDVAAAGFRTASVRIDGDHLAELSASETPAERVPEPPVAAAA